MPALSSQETDQVLNSARQLPIDAAVERVEDFVSRVLTLNRFQQADYFPDPDPENLLAKAVAILTAARQNILEDDCDVPDFVVYRDELGFSQIAGLNTYLELKDINAAHQRLRGRLTQHEPIREALRRLEKGHHLEALASAIMNASCNYGAATRGSGDQGIDAIGWKELMMIDSAFSNDLVRTKDVLPGEKVFLFASSKAVIGGKRGKPKLLNPAHIRELVGGWIIQRTSTGIWGTAGIRMLSPVQMILVTTYRLSPQAKLDCHDLGIQIWGIPELVYLVCRWAPDPVFDAANGYAFSAPSFRSWWRERDEMRVVPADL